MYFNNLGGRRHWDGTEVTTVWLQQPFSFYSDILFFEALFGCLNHLGRLWPKWLNGKTMPHLWIRRQKLMKQLQFFNGYFNCATFTLIRIQVLAVCDSHLWAWVCILTFMQIAYLNIELWYNIVQSNMQLHNYVIMRFDYVICLQPSHNMPRHLCTVLP